MANIDIFNFKYKQRYATTKIAFSVKYMLSKSYYYYDKKLSLLITKLQYTQQIFCFPVFREIKHELIIKFNYKTKIYIVIYKLP
jgi:hypothetical protein